MMNRFLLIHSPGDNETYDYSSRVAGLDFDFGSIVGEVLTPNENNWKTILRALHEYAHFYQFMCTTYGFLNSFFTFCQAILVQSFLVELSREGGSYHRPLVTGELPAFNESRLTTGILHMIRGLESIRLGLYGFSQFEQIEQVAFKETLEGVMIKTFLQTQFGIRKFIFKRSVDFSPPRYLIEDVLESHAHSLSTAWVIGLMKRQGINKAVIDDVANYSMDLARGPYKEYIKFASSGDPWWDHWTYSALCDIALNPPLFNFEGRLPKETALLLVEPNWNPTLRLWQLVKGAVERGLPTPGNLNDPEMGGGYLKEIMNRYDYGEDYVAKFPESESFIIPLKDASLRMLRTNEAPISINLMWLDSLGIFQNICRLRELTPLLLSGMPQQLELLFQTVGGPNIICRTENEIRWYRRSYLGLSVLGLVKKDEMENESEKLYRSSTLSQFAVNRLLYYKRSEEDESVIPAEMAESAVQTFLSSYGISTTNLN